MRPPAPSGVGALMGFSPPEHFPPGEPHLSPGRCPRAVRQGARLLRHDTLARLQGFAPPEESGPPHPVFTRCEARCSLGVRPSRVLAPCKEPLKACPPALRPPPSPRRRRATCAPGSYPLHGSESPLSRRPTLMGFMTSSFSSFLWRGLARDYEFSSGPRRRHRPLESL